MEAQKRKAERAKELQAQAQGSAVEDAELAEEMKRVQARQAQVSPHLHPPHPPFLIGCA